MREKYKPYGNFKSSGMVYRTRCAGCEHCWTVDRDRVRCVMDVYKDGEPFSRERVFTGDGVLMPHCFFYENTGGRFTPQQFKKMQAVEEAV